MTGQLREIGLFPCNRMASNLLRVKVKFVSLTELTAFWVEALVQCWVVFFKSSQVRCLPSYSIATTII